MNTKINKGKCSKLRIQELEVKSFVTKIDNSGTVGRKGGVGTDMYESRRICEFEDQTNIFMQCGTV